MATISRPLVIATSLLLGCYPVTAIEPHRIEPPQSIGSIERLDPSFDRLVPPDAKIEALADGFEWSEGPLWVPKLDNVIFSDIPRNSVYAWSESNGLSVYLSPSGYTGKESRGGELGANGLALDNEGGLLLCQHGDRRLARMTADIVHPQADYETVAGKYRGKRFHSPNDLTVHSNGTIFFTDPPYGLQQQLSDPARELEFQGIYKVSPQGKVELLIRDLARPNGIALSHDEKTLYVAQSHSPNKIIMAYRLDEDLQIGEGRVFFDANELGENRRGSPDGMTVDADGNVFATGPGGVLVLDPTGRHLGTLLPGELTSNCTLGNGGTVLYLTADRYLCRVKLKPTDQELNSQ